MQKTPETPQTWRQFLRKILLEKSKSEIEQIRAKLGNVDARTLNSWANGDAVPRMISLVLLMSALPEYEDVFPFLVQAEFPAAYEQYEASKKQIDLTATTIRVDVYERILRERAFALDSHAFWGICVLALRAMIDQLSQGNEVLVAVLVKCVAPSGDQVTQLQEYIIEANTRGTRNPMYYLGINSLAGNIVATGRPHVYNDMCEATLVTTDSFAKTMQSVAGYPVRLNSKIAGAVLLYTTQQHFFSRRHQELIQKYSELLALGFLEKDFFDDFALQVIPEPEVQQRWLSALRDRITERLVRAEMSGHPVTYTQAETLVLEQLLEGAASDGAES